MNKNELIKHVAVHAEVTNKQAEAVLDALITAITEAVRCGCDVNIADLGKFSRTERQAMLGRNPRTGESLQIPAKHAPKFTAAKALKTAVNS